MRRRGEGGGGEREEIDEIRGNRARERALGVSFSRCDARGGVGGEGVRQGAAVESTSRARIVERRRVGKLIAARGNFRRLPRTLTQTLRASASLMNGARCLLTRAARIDRSPRPRAATLCLFVSLCLGGRFRFSSREVTRWMHAGRRRLHARRRRLKCLNDHETSRQLRDRTELPPSTLLTTRSIPLIANRADLPHYAPR